MGTFLDIDFPLEIAYNSKGGPVFETIGTEISSGEVIMNSEWSYPRHEYDAALGVKSITQLEELIKFFMVVKGAAYTFRFRAPGDNKSCADADTPADTDCIIGTGDDSEVDFQIVKTYTYSGYTRSRKIITPISGVVVSIDDVGQGAGWSVDTSTGIITFSSAPANAEVIKAGFTFDTPCFLADKLETNFINYKLGTATIILTEDKNPVVV